MKTRIFVLICVAVIMAACCGGNKGNNAEKKACCKDSTEKACCKGSTEKACKGSTEKACCKATEIKKIISAKVFIKADKVDNFLTATKNVIEKSRAEEGCISYSLYQDPQDKTVFLFFEEWKNQEAVEFHFSTEHFKKFNEMLSDFASKDGIITIYDSIDQKTI